MSRDALSPMLVANGAPGTLLAGEKELRANKIRLRLSHGGADVHS